MGRGGLVVVGAGQVVVGAVLPHEHPEGHPGRR